MGLSYFVYADFSRANGVVKDSLTRLQWQDNYSDNGEETKRVEWIEAIEYCENLVLAGENDWRLPSINELSSIVDYSRQEPSLNSMFEYVEFDRFDTYWSSTTFSGYSGNFAWRVYFSYGYQYYGTKAYSGYVRCVREGQ